jgi:hypothetical protein
VSGTKTLLFPIETVLTFLTHYTDGAVPMDCKPLGIYTHPTLTRYICLEVESTQWQDDPNPDGSYDPAQIRFMGGKVAKWGSKGQEIQWGTAPDSLKQ